MAREVTILVAVKNAVKVGLSKAWKEMQDFGQTIMHVGKFFATAFLTGATAVAGFAAKALSAYAEVEKGQRALEGAFSAYGEEVAVNTEKVKQFTAAIQDETGADADALVAQAARLRMLGVQASQLAAATKATVALKSAGMDEAIATKAIAQAYQGNYTALSKYIPAIRAASTEQEKAAALNDFVTKGYEQQKGMLNTVSGQWGLLKERIQDVWEEVGKSIENNGELTRVMKLAGDAVKEFGKAVSAWAAEGGMTEMMVGVAEFGNGFLYWFDRIKNGFGVVIAILKDGWESEFGYFFNVLESFRQSWTQTWGYMKDLAIAAWEKIKHPLSDFQAPDASGMIAAQKNVLKSLVGIGAGTLRNTNEVLDAQDKAEADHAARSEAIAKWQAAAMNVARQTQVKDTAVAVAAEEQLEAEGADKVEDTAMDLTEKIKSTLEDRKGNEKAALDEIVGLHEAAASEASNAWKQVDPFAAVSGDRTARDESKWSPGGTVVSKGKGSGVYASGFRDYTHGSLLGGNIAGDVGMGGNQTNEKILGELKTMNANQKRLLTLG